MAGETPAVTIVTQKSDSGILLSLHPLVLLTISDYITRHTLRQQKTPIVGALLGQLNGRETTIEHAFECKADGAGGTLDMQWFERRLQQMKDVHKAPLLDLVGWYTTMSTTGPQQHHMPIQIELNNAYPECSLLLGFHPTSVLEGSVGGKLPLTIYETSLESMAAESQDVDMDGENTRMKMVYKEAPYTVETGEAEMIGVDFVAKGGGNATAVESKTGDASAAKEPTASQKGKKRAAGQAGPEPEPDIARVDDQHVLSREDEELVASLSARANAIKMLHSRIKLISTYLEKLPPAFLKGDSYDTEQARAAGHSEADHSILRSVQALLTRLALLVPYNNQSFEDELSAEQNDVNLVNLLSLLTENIESSRLMGRKFGVVEAGRNTGTRRGGSARDVSNMDFGRQMGASEMMM